MMNEKNGTPSLFLEYDTSIQTHIITKNRIKVVHDFNIAQHTHLKISLGIGPMPTIEISTLLP